MAGWFTVERDGDHTRIEIDKQAIRSDTRQAIDKGRDILDQREQERLAQQQQGGPTGWPPAAAPMPGNGVQGAGFATQPQFGNQQGGNSQFGNQQGFNSNGQNFSNQQNQNGQANSGGFNPSFPVPGGNQQPQQQPRWSEMPPPWQQQTR